jgi:hypothetical protein
MKTAEIGPFKGENNRLPDYALSGKDGAFVRSAVNVDLSGAGTFKRRPGSERIVSGTDCHSIWAIDDHAYYVDHRTLYSLSADYTATAVLTGLTPFRPMTYADAGAGRVFCTNKDGLWRLSGESATLAGVAPPQSAPIATVTQDGSLAAGAYQFVVTLLSADGEESAATRPEQVDVPENGRITFSGIPQVAGHTTALYLSPPNGDELYRITAGAPESAVVAVPPRTDRARCKAILLETLPPGEIVRYSGGRLLVANGDMLYYSEPFALALHNPRKNYVRFESQIDLLEPVEGGAFVAAGDQTYWIGGDISAASLAVVLPYGAVRYSSSRAPNSNAVWWMSKRGAVVAGPGGEVKNVQEQNVAVNPSEVGASAVMETDGMRRLIAALFNQTDSRMAAQSWMDAEIVRTEEAA